VTEIEGYVVCKECYALILEEGEWQHRYFHNEVEGLWSKIWELQR
jgi:hypothetical protein